jgi:hypothetical protein
VADLPAGGKNKVLVLRLNVANWGGGGDSVLGVAGELSNRGNVLNVIRFGVGTDSEVLRNPPEEDLASRQF